MERVHVLNDLGVLNDVDLCFMFHIYNDIAKAAKTKISDFMIPPIWELKHIERIKILYYVLRRPLEYSVLVWSLIQKVPRQPNRNGINEISEVYAQQTDNRHGNHLPFKVYDRLIKNLMKNVSDHNDFVLAVFHGKDFSEY